MSETTNWYKTDNVAKVFLATLNRRDTRTMRLSCELTEKVDPEALQKALMNTIHIRPQLQVRIRRGIFWHYMEPTDVLPTVCEEKGRPCPLLYGPGYRGVLHYRVSYFENRINLDIFHALSDGTGAIEILQVLVGQYLKLKHPEALSGVKIGSGASAGDLEQDSFSQYYDKDDKNEIKNEGKPAPKKSYHFRGMKLPYDQLQFLEIKMPVESLLPKAKAAGATMGSYMAARIMMAMYMSMPVLKRKMPVTVSMPVNLRNFFPSETSRNFFNSVTVSHVFTGDETIESLAKEIDAGLKENLKPEKVRLQMDNYQKLERMLFVRMVPLAIKQPVVRYFSKKENKKVSFVLSNMGMIKVPEEIKPYIAGFGAFCSHQESFFTAYTYNGVFKLSVTYAYTDTTFLKDFVRSFSNEGIEVTVNATEVVR